VSYGSEEEQVGIANEAGEESGKVTAHFVTFYSPGTFVAETTTREIESWDIEKAKSLAEDIVERYNAKPYGFRFLTREREDGDLDSHTSAQSNLYYLKGRIRTLEEVERTANPDERILLSNMRANGWNRVVETTTPWKWTQPLEDSDVILEVVQ